MAASPALQNRQTSLVFPGPDGKLAYKPDSFGNYVPDFSHAGYMGGGVRLPEIAVKAMVKPGSGDDTPQIQAAIDEVSRLPLDDDGFRGAVLLERGRYNLDGQLSINTSGVVLRGEGQGEDGTILFGRGKVKDRGLVEDGVNVALVLIGGRSGIEETPGTRQAIVDEFVPLGAHSFTVADASGFSVGDTIIVRRLNTAEWYLKMDLLAPDSPRPHESERIIATIDGNSITVDVPLTASIEAEWGGGEIAAYTDAGRIEQVGVENLRGVSDFNPAERTTEYGNLDRAPFIGGEYYNDEDHFHEFIKLDNIRDCWVRDIIALHFAFTVVNMEGGTRSCTVQDCESLEPVGRCGGGRRFIYQISGQLCLVQRCKSDRGRHSFVLGGHNTCGPNVFHQCSATRPFSSSEPHSSLVVGSLYDNVHAPIALRFAKSDPGRWMGFFNFLWNCEGDFLCQQPPVGQNYAFGQIGIHALVFNTGLQVHDYGNGHIECWDEHVEPESLYLTQLRDRLGDQAVENIRR